MPNHFHKFRPPARVARLDDCGHVRIRQPVGHRHPKRAEIAPCYCNAVMYGFNAHFVFSRNTVLPCYLNDSIAVALLSSGTLKLD